MVQDCSENSGYSDIFRALPAVNHFNIGDDVGMNFSRRIERSKAAPNLLYSTKRKYCYLNDNHGYLIHIGSTLPPEAVQ